MANIIREVGPKEVFKHLILDRLLKSMAGRYQNGFTYIDFTPGPGHYQGVNAGLGLLYAHAHKEIKAEKTNFFQEYIASILRYNGETNAQNLKLPPELGFEPPLYPSNAGFASMRLRDIDKAIYVEDDPLTINSLKRNLKDCASFRRTTFASGHKNLPQLAKAIVPPINGKGLVSFDLDIAMAQIEVDGTFDNQYFKSQQTYLNQAGSLFAMMIKRWPNGTFFVPYPMTSKIPPIQLARAILSSGAKNVLSCSMYLEGDPEKQDSAKFGGDGVGVFIVNPPQELDHRLAEALPRLKTEVFMPAILLDEDTVESEANVRYLTMNEQPWEDLMEGKKKATWEYFRKAEWSDEMKEEFEKNRRATAGDEFKVFMNMDDERYLEDAYDMVDNEEFPAPEKFTAEEKKYKHSWKYSVHEQKAYQEPQRATTVRVRKGE